MTRTRKIERTRKRGQTSSTRDRSIVRLEPCRTRHERSPVASSDERPRRVRFTLSLPTPDARPPPSRPRRMAAPVAARRRPTEPSDCCAARIGGGGGSNGGGVGEMTDPSPLLRPHWMLQRDTWGRGGTIHGSPGFPGGQTRCDCVCPACLLSIESSTCAPFDIYPTGCRRLS